MKVKACAAGYVDSRATIRPICRRQASMSWKALGRYVPATVQRDRMKRSNSVSSFVQYMSLQVAHRTPAAMSAFPALLGEQRKWPGDRQSDENDPLPT